MTVKIDYSKHLKFLFLVLHQEIKCKNNEHHTILYAALSNSTQSYFNTLYLYFIVDAGVQMSYVTCHAITFFHESSVSLTR